MPDPGWVASMLSGPRRRGRPGPPAASEWSSASTGPISAIRPSIRTAIRSDTLRANSRSCVTTIAVSDAPSALRLSTSSVMSRAFVGIEAGRRLVVEHQLRARARAPARSRRASACPPDSSAGSFASTSLEAHPRQEAMHALGDLGLRQARVLAEGIGDVLVDGQRVEQRGALEDEAHWRRRTGRSASSRSGVMSTPRVRIRPRSGLMRPAVRRRSTVFPDPLPPITVTVLPRGDLQVEAPEHGHLVEGLPDPLERHGRPRRRARSGQGPRTATSRGSGPVARAARSLS